MSYSGRPLRVILSVPIGYEYEKIFLDSSVEVVSLTSSLVDISDSRFVSPASRLLYESGDYQLPLFTPTSTHGLNDRALIDSIDGYILLNAFFFEGVFTTRKPFAVYVADFIQRFVPEIFDNPEGYDGPVWTADRNQRAVLKGATVAFGTTQNTLGDLANYGGVERDRIVKFPMFAIDIASGSTSDGSVPMRSVKNDFDGTQIDATREDYFLWVTNATPHKNHNNALQMLSAYYARGGKLKCYICGPMTHLFKPGSVEHPYIDMIHSRMQSIPSWKRNLRLISYTDEALYLEMLRKARFLWHNVLYDNGSFSIIEAALVGTRILSSDYPQLREIADTYKIDCTYFDPRDVKLGTAALFQMEDASARAQAQPPILQLPPLDLKPHLAELLQRMFASPPRPEVDEAAA